MYDNALNGDRIARQQFANLIQRYNIITAIETGTYHGVTTEWLASLVANTHTMEIDLRYQIVARERLHKHNNVEMHLGNSPQILRKILPQIQTPAFFFLDAHWGGYCPLTDELVAIADSRVYNPVIAIHDFLVPGSNLGYDTYQGMPFSLEYINHYLPAIYPTGYLTSYNDDSAEGARRGIIYITPTQGATTA